MLPPRCSHCYSRQPPNQLEPALIAAAAASSNNNSPTAGELEAVGVDLKSPLPLSFPYCCVSHSCVGTKRGSIRSHAVQNHAVRSRGSSLAAAMPDCYRWIIPAEKRHWLPGSAVLWHYRWSVFYCTATHEVCSNTNRRGVKMQNVCFNSWPGSHMCRFI